MVNTSRKVLWLFLALIGAWAVVFPADLPWLVAEPFSVPGVVQDAINVGINSFVTWAKPVLRMVSDGVNWSVRSLQWMLHGLPWPWLVLLTAFLGWWLKGVGLATFVGLAMLYMALSGHWVKSMNTLAMVGVAVPLALGFGFLLGVLGGKSIRCRRFIEPSLDMMQTIPTFAYLVPLIVLFGFGPVPGVIASMIYAAPPITRNVMLGLRMVPEELHEVASISGASTFQRFFMIELPNARNQILIGLNQSILASLSMVIIAAVIGGFDDIGREVLVATNKGSARFGEALSAGIIIVLMAVVIDLLSRASATNSGSDRSKVVNLLGWTALGALLGVSLLLPLDQIVTATASVFRGVESAINEGLSHFIRNHGATLDMIKNTALMYVLLPLRIGLEQAVLPFTWGFTFTETHKQIYLAAILALSSLLLYRRHIGLAVFVAVLGLVMLRGFTFLPWWVVAGGVSFAALRASGLRLAVTCFAMMMAITLFGHWKDAMYSVYLCSSAVAICLVVGCPLGVLAAKSDTVSRVLRPINDTLQSIPLYIFLIPAVALFQINEFSAMVAIVLYAIVPIIRYTEHGLRSVPAQLLEATVAQGCTPLQRLFYIEFPVARPGILLGLNQTVLFALAMLIIAVLVGARGLAEQVNIGLRDADTGLGLTAGFSIAFIAMMADRILRGWAEKMGR
jgi:glycine betaine/proline transport system permease protein